MQITAPNLFIDTQNNSRNNADLEIHLPTLNITSANMDPINTKEYDGLNIKTKETNTEKRI